MTRFLGLDVSQKMTAICVVDDARRAPRENGCDFCGGRGMKKTIGKRTYDEATATRVASYEFDHPDAILSATIYRTQEGDYFLVKDKPDGDQSLRAVDIKWIAEESEGRCHVIENWTWLRRNMQLQSRRDDFTPRLQSRCPEGLVRSC
jgi:hypothetical protein